MFPASDKQLDNKMSETAFSTTTPSMSLKRKQSIDNNVENENYLPKKRRESAIRSENNLKMLIQNGQIDTSKQKDSSKQKESPKKVLSLAKEARTETLATLISAGKFDKLDKLYIKSVEAASKGSKEDVETSDSEPEPLPSPQPKTKLESEMLNESKPTNTSTTNDLNPTNTTKVQNPSNFSNLPNPTTITKVPNLTNTFNVSNSTNTTKVRNPTTTTEVPNEPNTNNNVKSNKITTTHVSDLEINKNVPNTTNKNNPLLLVDIETLNTREPVDNTTAEVSYTNNLDQNEEVTDFDQSRSSLDAEVKTLHNLILSLAPDTDDNGTGNYRTGDIKYIEDIYQTVLSVKSKLDAVYKQRSIELRKSFESIQLIVPELKRGLILPTLEELKENSLVTGEAPKLLPSLDEQ